MAEENRISGIGSPGKGEKPLNASDYSLSAALFPARPTSVRRTVRFTPEGLDSLLIAPDQPILPGTSADTYTSLGADMTGSGAGKHPHAHDIRPLGFLDGEINEGDLDDESRFVGRDLQGKQAPAHPLEVPGPNPYGKRQFLGAEFPGMFTFDPSGKPTFLSRFPEAKSIADIKEIRINIATKLPDYMTGDTSQVVEVESMEEEAFGGKPLTEAFTPMQGTLLKQIQRYAQEFEAAYGIKITYGFDLPDPHLSLMGYNSPNQNLLGFATFPPSINQWPSMEGLGDHPGYMLLNHQYTSKATAKECYDLFAHEFGHTLGFAHPHDIAILQMDKREALTATKMAYTDLTLRAFQHVITDGKGEPILKKGKPQYYSEGPEEGVLDLGFRKWVAMPPVMGHVSDPDPDSPTCDLYKGSFDLQAHFNQALQDNAKSYVFKLEKLLPMVPMINDGKHTVLRGTTGDDLLDTNPGYNSVVRDATLGVDQRFCLIEGHFEKVLGISGNNTIITAKAGAQEIHPGKGASEVQFLYPEFSGDKRIVGQSGKDTLVLTDEVMKRNGFHAEKGKGGSLVLKGEKATIALEGKGVARIAIIDQHGGRLSVIETDGLSAEQLNQRFFDNQNWQKPKPENIAPAASQDTADWVSRMAQKKHAAMPGRGL